MATVETLREAFDQEVQAAGPKGRGFSLQNSAWGKDQEVYGDRELTTNEVTEILRQKVAFIIDDIGGPDAAAIGKTVRVSKGDEIFLRAARIAVRVAESLGVYIPVSAFE